MGDDDDLPQALASPPSPPPAGATNGHYAACAGRWHGRATTTTHQWELLPPLVLSITVPGEIYHNHASRNPIPRNTPVETTIITAPAN